MRKMAVGLVFYFISIGIVVTGMILNMVFTTRPDFYGKPLVMAAIDIMQRCLASYVVLFAILLIFWPFRLPPALFCMFYRKHRNDEMT